MPVWTPEDDELLRNLSAQGLSARQIAPQLGRSLAAVRWRRTLFKLTSRPPQWTAREDALLRRRYAEGASFEAIAEEIGRLVPGVATRANQALNLRSNRGRRWTVEEDALFNRLVAEGATLEEIAIAVNRTKGSVSSRLRWRGIRHPDMKWRGVRWTDDEDAALRQRCAARVTWRDIAEELGRSLNSVKGRAKSLGVQKTAVPGAVSVWTPQQDDELRELRARGLTLQQIADQIGRTRCVIRYRAKMLNVRHSTARARAIERARPTRGRRWTAEEDARFNRLITEGATLEEVATSLDRSQGSVRARLYSRGVRTSDMKGVGAEMAAGDSDQEPSSPR